MPEGHREDVLNHFHDPLQNGFLIALSFSSLKSSRLSIEGGSSILRPPPNLLSSTLSKFLFRKEILSISLRASTVYDFDVARAELFHLYYKLQLGRPRRTIVLHSFKDKDGKS
jgi:hypothetical protein